VATAKTAEAKLVVGAVARNAAVQYERERDIAELLLAGGGTAANTHLLCTSATPVPANIAQVRGTKYQPSAAVGADFMTGSPIAGWQCLSFSIMSPISYQYRYLMGGGFLSQSIAGAPLPAGSETFEASAQGDTDADGNQSTFARVGEVRNGQVIMSTAVFMDNELE
jgi:type IV pilus assembly protein PilA